MRTLYLAILFILPLLGSADELLPVPTQLPNNVTESLRKERTALINEQHALKNRIKRYKSKCKNTSASMEHICNAEKQSLYSADDKINQKVSSFNKKIKELTRSKPPTEP